MTNLKMDESLLYLEEQTRYVTRDRTAFMSIQKANEHVVDVTCKALHDILKADPNTAKRFTASDLYHITLALVGDLEKITTLKRSLPIEEEE